MKADRRKKFVDLAEKRVSKALRDLKLIGNLSNRSNYSYTQEDSQKIVKALRRGVDECRARFEQGGKDEDEVFKL